ncbi:MAG: methyltransferase domain-containing protein [Planctomycetes bacterium]|nr:methyltransferase domain-containing protein [Planctomycetota bacterium]
MSYALFWKRLLARPGQLHAIAPSSRALARAITAGLELSSDELIVELGCGTGPFTRELEALRKTRRLRYLGVELDPELVRHLRLQHPRLAFCCDDAADLPRILRRCELSPAGAVISGLPLAAMDGSNQERILDAVLASLRPGGTFRHFTYLHYQVTTSARRLRRLLADRCGTYSVRALVLRNLPPALILEARAAGRSTFTAQ